MPVFARCGCCGARGEIPPSELVTGASGAPLGWIVFDLAHLAEATNFRALVCPTCLEASIERTTKRLEEHTTREALWKAAGRKIGHELGELADELDRTLMTPGALERAFRDGPIKCSGCKSSEPRCPDALWCELRKDERRAWRLDRALEERETTNAAAAAAGVCLPCQAIDAGRSAFCRTHGRTFIAAADEGSPFAGLIRSVANSLH